MLDFFGLEDHAQVTKRVFSCNWAYGNPNRKLTIPGLLYRGDCPVYSSFWACGDICLLHSHQSTIVWIKDFPFWWNAILPSDLLLVWLSWFGLRHYVVYHLVLLWIVANRIEGPKQVEFPTQILNKKFE